jgi:GH25 family lysozyme M1 (1,4-beta-N-acetylmuramidase)
VSAISGTLIIIVGLALAGAAAAGAAVAAANAGAARDQAGLAAATASPRSPSAAAPSATVTAPVVRGVDVSGFTTVTDWSKVKAAGMSFTGIEAAQGKTVVNASYASQASGALAAGLRVMPYVFANPGRFATDPTFTGAEQFSLGWAVINSVSGHPYQAGSQWLPVVLDLEWDQTNFPQQECYGLDATTMVSWIQSFVDAAKAQTGVAPVIYTNAGLTTSGTLQSWWQDCTGNSTQFTADPLWVADWGVSSPAIPTAWGAYTFWQSSSTGTVTGITGSVDLDQMKGIALSAPALATTTGSPVSARVGVSGPDLTAGYQPTIKATGLPGGLTMDSTGLLTGWPAAAGSYNVTVSASDALGGTGATSFAWTVKPAPGSGMTGTVRQHGGSNLCLDDPSSKTANGTAIDLATCTGKSNQAWTAAQDGTIRVLGHCLESSVASLILMTCNASAAEQWKAGTYGALVSVRYGTCLNGPSAAAKSGTRPTLAACQNSGSKVNQHWTRPWAPVVSGVAARCLGVGSSGVALLLTCSNVSAQHWMPEPAGTFAIQSTGKCLAESGQTAGAAIVTNPCNNTAPSQQWRLVAAGNIATQLKSATSGLCVTVPSASSPSGAKLFLGACSASLTATWRVA